MNVSFVSRGFLPRSVSEKQATLPGARWFVLGRTPGAGRQTAGRFHARRMDKVGIGQNLAVGHDPTWPGPGTSSTDSVPLSGHIAVQFRLISCTHANGPIAVHASRKTTHVDWRCTAGAAIS